MESYLRHIGNFYITDHLTALLVLIVLLFAGWRRHLSIQSRQELSPNWYFQGFVFKVVFAYAFALVYFFYYAGGDTIAYFSNGLIMQRLLADNPAGFAKLFLSPSVTWSDYFAYFNHYTGYPEMSLCLKGNNFMVVKFATVLNIAGLNNFFATSMIFGAIAYQFVWKLYRTFCTILPGNDKLLGITFLFFPSFVFWSSGIMKDTICMASMAPVVYAFHQVFILKKKRLSGALSIAVASYMLLIIKPYLLLALVPGLLVWGSFEWLRSFKSPVFSILVFPVIMSVTAAGIYVFFRQSMESSSLGSTDEALRYATVVQQDLIRSEQYGENFIDIGRFDPTIAGISSKAPLALSVGLFMPFIWQAGNPVMVISGLENTLLLLLTIYFIFRTRIYGMFVYTFSNPVLLFCLSFSMITAFIVGLTTANFGALVRYKMPLLPFFVSYFIILIDTMRVRRSREELSETGNEKAGRDFRNAEKRILARRN